MTGAQGFSSYVCFTKPPKLGSRDGLIQAGVLVLLNLALDTSTNSPTGFGRRVLGHLLGTNVPDVLPGDAPDDADEGVAP